jgi:hypothetical protein
MCDQGLLARYGLKHRRSLMTDIIATDGTKFSINDDDVTMVVGPYPHDPANRCYIHGINKGPIPVDEDAKTLVATLHPKTSFAVLTRPDGSPVWINGGAVSSIVPAIPDDTAPGEKAGAVLTVGGEHQAVQEDVATAKKLIDEHDGKV